MFLDVGERSEEGMAQRRRAVEVAVVRAGLSGVRPEPLCCLEVRSLGREREPFDLAVVFGKILQDFRLLMIRGVVLNQIDPMATAVIMRQQVAVDESQIRLGVEVFGLVSPHKIAVRHADRAAPTCDRGWGSAETTPRPRKRSPPLRAGRFF